MSKRPFEPDDSREAASGADRRRKTGRVRLTCEDYSVGWICAIATELGAAKAFLDETHERPNHIRHDDNNYTFGRMGDHNVAIAVLPSGEYGISSAAGVARDLMRSFPNAKTRLMVGVGGGAPSPRRDIRLGDVVVSEPRDGNGGVFQYDFGKTIQDQGFRTTGFLDQPPRHLRTALNGLKADYMNEGCQIQYSIETVLQSKPQLRLHYQRPHSSTDRLYPSHHTHPAGDERSCSIVCDNLSTEVTWRTRRTDQEDDGPVIHYGLIASANKLMKDALIRDKLSKEKDVLCFEMEAAGLMNSFSCLVIRGICDYADTHKNKKWQGYAAMAATAFAKDLLSQIPASETATRAEPPPRAISLALRQSAEPQGPMLNKDQKLNLVKSLKFDQIDARFENIKRAHAQTCGWLLQKSEYLDWLNPDKLEQHQGLLWMRGKPGAGKSTLMKFALKNMRDTKRAWIITSFFFNARGTDLEKSTLGMYRSLLFQLLNQQPALMTAFDSLGVADRNRVNDQSWTVELLKDLFEEVLRKIGESAVVCFIDALDECDEEQIRDMVGFFQTLGELALCKRVQFRVFFSSRHYPNITCTRGLNLVLEGEDGHDKDIASYINKELILDQTDLAMQIKDELKKKAAGVFMWVALVVGILNKDNDGGQQHRLREKLKSLPSDLQSLFRDMLMRDLHDRNQLLLCIQWVLFARQPMEPKQLYCAIVSGTEPAYLSKWESDKISIDHVKKFILNSSKGLAEITKSKTPTVQFIHESVRDFLLKGGGLETVWPGLGLGGNFRGESHERLKHCCLTYMNIGATHLSGPKFLPKASSKDAANLRQETSEAFPFLEYAVQNVLYHSEEAQTSGVDQSGFLQSFQPQGWIPLLNRFERFQARRHRLGTSLLYILAEYDMPALIRAHPWSLSDFNLTRENFGIPIFAALVTGSKRAASALFDVSASLFPANSPLPILCRQHFENMTERIQYGRNFRFSKSKGILYHALELDGDDLLFRYLFALHKDAPLDSCDATGRTSLSLAASKGHEEIVRSLLDTGKVEVNSRDRGRNFNYTPLLFAAKEGHAAIVKLLLNTDKIDTNLQAMNGWTALSLAASKGHEEIVRLLLDTGKVNVNLKTEEPKLGYTPLLFATEGKHAAIVKLLLNTDKIDPNLQDSDGRTALSLAASKGYEEIVRLLLNTEKVDVNLRAGGRKLGYTPLLSATEKGHAAIVKLLLNTEKIDTSLQDSNGRTAFSNACGRGHQTIVQHFISTGKVDMRLEEVCGRTPLWVACQNGHTVIVALLLLTGQIDINSKNEDGLTPLSYACKHGKEAIVRRLLYDGKIEIDSKDMHGRTPLFHACQRGHGAVVIQLLHTGKVDINSKDNYGRTPLSYACSYKKEIIVRLLLNTGKIDVNSKNRHGLTALSYACMTENEDIVRLLLSTDKIEIDSKDMNGRTPFSWACGYGNMAIIRLLLGSGKVDIGSKDMEGRTPCSWAYRNGYGREVLRLLCRGAQS